MGDPACQVSFDNGAPHASDVLPLASLLWVQADNVLGLQATVKEQVRHTLFACRGQHPTDAFPGRLSVLKILRSCPSRLRQRNSRCVGVRSQGVENHASEAGSYIPQGRHKAVKCLFLLRSSLPEPLTGPGHIRRFACQAIYPLPLGMTPQPCSYDLAEVVLYYLLGSSIAVHHRATQ